MESEELQTKSKKLLKEVELYFRGLFMFKISVQLQTEIPALFQSYPRQTAFSALEYYFSVLSRFSTIVTDSHF